MTYYKLLNNIKKHIKHTPTVGAALCRTTGIADQELLKLVGNEAWDVFLGKYVKRDGSVRV